jgi:hypothetical protein
MGSLDALIKATPLFDEPSRLASVSLAGSGKCANNARSMATVDFNVGSGKKSLPIRAEKPPEPAIGHDDLPLFRFGLRQLFLFVAAFSILLAALAISHGLTVVMILLSAAVVVMHVFATALGTKLQARTEQERSRQRAVQSEIIEANESASEQSAKLQAIRSAPRSPWHARGCTYLPWLPRLVVGAMIVGGIGGGIFLGGTIGHRTSLEGIIVGAASFAVLGGWISFLGGNFYGVFRHGFREALAEQKKDQKAQR